MSHVPVRTECSQNCFKILLLFYFIFLLSPHLSASEAINPDRLKSQCARILGIEQGTIIVIDLQRKKPIVVLNPEIAYSRPSMPGSLFKLVTAASLLENRRVSLNETVECKNKFSFMGKKYICSEIEGHGKVNLVKALSNSCSIFFFHMSQRLKPAELKKTAEKFSFGEAVPYYNVPVKPAPGVCSPPKDPRKFIEFSVGDQEGIKITPFQAANLLTIISSGKSLEGCPRKGEFSSKILEILRKAMREAAVSGTCKELSSLGIPAAGKTGTATNIRLPGKTHGWFIGFVPYKKPRYGVVVFLEDGKGAADACPRALEVMKILKQSIRQ